jgi:hypothetical protein
MRLQAALAAWRDHVWSFAPLDLVAKNTPNSLSAFPEEIPIAIRAGTGVTRKISVAQCRRDTPGEKLRGRIPAICDR